MTVDSCAPLRFLVVFKAVCRDGDSCAQNSHPVFRDSNDARTKLNGDWQALPELHQHSGQAQ